MEGKKSKKKVLLYYLILAASLLIIAAVTVTVVFTVGRNSSPAISDAGQTQTPDDGKKPDDGKNPDDDKKPDDKPTGGDTKWGLPLDNVSSTCGYEFTFDKTLTRFAVHQGMDFEATAGDNVYAVMDGTVKKVVTNDFLNENYVTIAHTGGVTSTYRYVNATEGLKAGDTVKRGDVIGTVAAVGGMEMNEGEHLHFEMSVDGRTVDPNTYLDLAEK